MTLWPSHNSQLQQLHLIQQQQHMMPEFYHHHKPGIVCSVLPLLLRHTPLPASSLAMMRETMTTSSYLGPVTRTSPSPSSLLDWCCSSPVYWGTSSGTMRQTTMPCPAATPSTSISSLTHDRQHHWVTSASTPRHQTKPDMSRSPRIRPDLRENQKWLSHKDSNIFKYLKLMGLLVRLSFGFQWKFIGSDKEPDKGMILRPNHIFQDV